MTQQNLDAPPSKRQKRDRVLFVRIKQENKEFVEAEADQEDLHEAVIVDKILDRARKRKQKK